MGVDKLLYEGVRLCNLCNVIHQEVYPIQGGIDDLNCFSVVLVGDDGLEFGCIHGGNGWNDRLIGPEIRKEILEIVADRRGIDTDIRLVIVVSGLSTPVGASQQHPVVGDHQFRMQLQCVSVDLHVHAVAGQVDPGVLVLRHGIVKEHFHIEAAAICVNNGFVEFG